MKSKRIVTATLLSAGMILGTATSAHAVDPTPSANLTVASYSSELAAYNVTSASFDAATVAFRTQISTYATALTAYKASTAALLQTYQTVLTANSPIKTAARYATVLAAFKAATVAYNNAEAQFMLQSGVYQAAVQSYEKSYQADVATYKTTLAMWEQLNKNIYMSFENSLRSANQTFATALLASKTKAQKAIALKKRDLRVRAAIAVRASARIALGAKPIKPVRQIKIGQSVAEFNAVRPVRPVMAI